MLASPLTLAADTNITSDKMKSLYPTDNVKKGSVALLPGCAQQVIGDDINQATIRLLNKFGFDVHILNGTGCCGAIEHHLGKATLTGTRIKSNLMQWSSALPQLDAIITNASGCGTMLKDYAYLLRADSEMRELSTMASRKTMDICEFLWRQNNPIKTDDIKNLKVAYQSPCSMQHGQGISQQPLNLLERLYTRLHYSIGPAADRYRQN